MFALMVVISCIGEGIDLGGCFDIFALDGTADGGRVDAHLLGQHKMQTAL